MRLRGGAALPSTVFTLSLLCTSSLAASHTTDVQLQEWKADRQVGSPIPLRSSGYVLESLEVASRQPGCSISYEFLVTEAVLPRKTRFQQAERSPSVTGSLDDYTTYGLFSLQCGKCSWGSARTQLPVAHAVPAGAFIPAEHAKDTATTLLLSSLR